MSDIPYLMQVPCRDELWLVDGERRFLITPRVYDLLANNGADLPSAYGIEELREQNAKLRELVQSLYRFSFDEYPDGTELNFADRLHELGVDE